MKLKLENISISYNAKNKTQTLLENVNIAADDNNIIALIGKNGCGKTTLLKTIMRMHKAMKGSIFIDSIDYKTFSHNAFARKISYVSTEIIHSDNLSIFDLVTLGRTPYINGFGNLQADDIVKIEHAISLCSIQNIQHKTISRISDGERQKAMIARAIAQDADLIIMDEPTAFLDIPSKHFVIDIMCKLRNESNKSIIFATHDIHLALSKADKIWLITPPKIICASPEELITSGILMDIFANEGLTFDMQSKNFISKI